MPNAPIYYAEDFDPWDPDDVQVAKNKDFTNKTKGEFTPVDELLK